jgi:phage terminase large subunit
MSESGQPALQFPEKLQFLFKQLMPDGITPVRYKVAYGGRGGAKSWGFARALLLISAHIRPLRVLCARQLQNSIEESVKQVLTDQIGQLGLSELFTIKQKYIIGPNGTEFFFEGIQHNTSKIKSYEGADVCWVEEANAVTESSWKILTPTIRKPGSEIWISFNPELEGDYTYQRFVVHPSKDTWVEKLCWSDNPWFPAVLMAEMLEMRERDYDGYLNVWEGHCRQMLDGVVYRAELQKAMAEGRIRAVPYDHFKPVDTFWDIGYSDSTSIWFAQRVGFETRVLDFYQSSSKTLEHYLKVLRNKGYQYGTDYLPHDAANKNSAALATGKTIKQILADSGRTVRIVPRLPIADGINAARMLFPNCYFDESRCAEGIQCLKHYRYEVDPDSKLLSRIPLHDQYSHAADAFRYLAIALKEPKRLKGGAAISAAAATMRKRLGLAGIPSLDKAKEMSWMG